MPRFLEGCFLNNTRQRVFILNRIMTISVLMSVYKAETPEYLNRALQSVWDDQTMKPAKIVVIQDGQIGQELEAILSKWKTLLGEQLCLLVNEQNLGLTKSLNRGISVIDTDLVARMDSDDISAPDRFEKQVEYLLKHPDVSIVGGSIQEFDSLHENLGVRTYPLTHEDALCYIHKASPLAHPSVMMRREIFDKIRYNEKYRMSQDIALWYDAICAGYKIGNIAEIVLYFRKAGDVFKRRAKAKAWNEFKIYMNGIYRLHGLWTSKYIYPIARLCFRLMPVFVVKWVYGSSVRNKFLQ